MIGIAIGMTIGKQFIITALREREVTYNDWVRCFSCFFLG